MIECNEANKLARTIAWFIQVEIGEAEREEHGVLYWHLQAQLGWIHESSLNVQSLNGGQLRNNQAGL